jgi:general stress protein YciG
VTDEKKTKSKRGFGGMSKEKRQAIAAMGGRKAHALGVAHEFGPKDGREAGAVGGRAVSKDRNHMAEIGRRGGLQRSARAKAKEDGKMPKDKGSPKDAALSKNAASSKDTTSSKDAA